MVEGLEYLGYESIDGWHAVPVPGGDAKPPQNMHMGGRERVNTSSDDQAASDDRMVELSSD